MAVLRNRCDLIGATHIPVAPRLIYKDSPDPILLGSGAARLDSLWLLSSRCDQLGCDLVTAEVAVTRSLSPPH